jgi:NADH-quinone oxidoreductase subunit M
MVLMGAVHFNFWIGALAALTLILSAAYTLWMYKRVVFGSVRNSRVAQLNDVGKREFALLGAMAVIALAIGIYPKPFTDAIDVSAANLLIETQRSAPGPETSAAADEHAQAGGAIKVAHFAD